MIDSHTHLDVCRPPNDELVAAAREAGITRMLTVGLDVATSTAALAAADAFPEVFVAAGHHPNQAADFTDEDAEALARLAADPRVVAVGETGMDFFRDRAPRDVQLRAFESQIEIARAVGKPLVIHTRDADDDTIATLRAKASGVEVLLHCFSMPDRVEECAAEGWWFSFAGNATYPRNAELLRASARAPADRLLVETDAPYLTPQPQRKHPNQPAFVGLTAAAIADRRGMHLADFDALVTENAARLLRW